MGHRAERTGRARGRVLENQHTEIVARADLGRGTHADGGEGIGRRGEAGTARGCDGGQRQARWGRFPVRHCERNLVRQSWIFEILVHEGTDPVRGLVDADPLDHGREGNALRLLGGHLHDEGEVGNVIVNAHPLCAETVEPAGEDGTLELDEVQARGSRGIRCDPEIVRNRGCRFRGIEGYRTEIQRRSIRQRTEDHAFRLERSRGLSGDRGEDKRSIVDDRNHSRIREGHTFGCGHRANEHGPRRIVDDGRRRQ